MSRPQILSMAIACALVFGPLAGAVSADDAKEIAAASAAFSRAYVEGDTAAIRDLYTQDAVLLPPGREIRGGEDIAGYFAPRPNRTNTSHSMESAELRVQGNIAIDIGTWHYSWRAGDDPEQSASGRYLVVWRRCPDGQWRMQYDMWHRPAR